MEQIEFELFEKNIDEMVDFFIRHSGEHFQRVDMGQSGYLIAHSPSPFTSQEAAQEAWERLQADLVEDGPVPEGI